MKIDLEKSLEEVNAKTGFNSRMHSSSEFLIALNRDYVSLRKRYIVRLRAMSCVQDEKSRLRAQETINNLLAQNL